MTQRDDDEWDDNENCVIDEQPQTWVYLNPREQIVIRQRREVHEVDPFVFFNIDALSVLIDALEPYLLAHGLEKDLVQQTELGRAVKARDKTAAARQRRYRDRRRNGAETVTADRNLTLDPVTPGENETAPVPLFDAAE